MDLKQTRLDNGRKVIKKFGGVASVSRKMGYKNASYLVQIFGPNPTRAPSDKTCRNIESALDLAEGYLDCETLNNALPSPEPINVSKLACAISLVNDIAREEGVTLSTERLAILVGLVLEGEHLSSEKWLRQVLQLLKQVADLRSGL